MLSLQMDRVPTRIARRSFARSHYAHLAVSMLMLAAAGGIALYRLNVLNQHSVRNDPEKYLRLQAALFRDRAERGDAVSQVALAELLMTGQGVSRDEAQAARWNKAAAEQGDATAQMRLARALVEGNGVSQDAAEAGAWLRKSAEQGQSDAQLNYGVFLFTGLGGTRDPVAGYRWMTRAADAGNRAAMAVREKARSELTPEQLKAAETSP